MNNRRKAQNLLSIYGFMELLIHNDLTEVDVIAALLELDMLDVVEPLDGNISLSYDDLEALLDDDD